MIFRDRRRIFLVFFLLVVGVLALVEWRARRVELAHVDLPDTTNVGTLSGDFTLVSGLDPAQVPALDSPNTVSIAEADGYLADEGRGLVVDLPGEEARFYPYQMLAWHHTVNDVLAGQPILISYSPLTGTARAHNRTVGEQVLTFDLSDRVWNSTMLIEDRETESLWVQLTDEAADGPLAGKMLDSLESHTLTWETFKRQFPRGTTLSRETGFTRDYTRNPYIGFDDLRIIYFPVETIDPRLHPKEFVYGVTFSDGTYKAYPRQYLVEEGKIIDSVNDQSVELVYSDGFLTISGDTVSKLVPAYWYAWAAVYTETDLYDPLGQLSDSGL